MAKRRKRSKAFINKLKRQKARYSKERTGLKWRIFRTLPLVAVGLLFVFYFSRAEAVQKFQTSFLDAQMRLDAPDDASDVVIVEITQNDFENLFERKTRPLNPPKLHQLISAVSRGKPCVIGVDIDTSFPEFGAENFPALNEWSPIIWARESEEIAPDVNTKIIPIDVLGGQAKFNENSGLPFLIDDANGVTRRYTRMIETSEGKIPSFAWAIFREAAKRECKGIKLPDEKEIASRESEEAALFIKYSRGNPNQNAANYGRLTIPASQIIEFDKRAEWQNNQLIKDKIVLIGGSYGEDLHQTPLGKMWGVEAIANVVETEIGGGGIKPPGFLTTALIALFDGFLIILLFQIFEWRRAFLLSVAALAALSLACSYLTFYSFSYWFLYAPVMFAVLLTEFFDRLKDKLKDYYKTELENIYTRLTGRKIKNRAASADEK